MSCNTFDARSKETRPGDLPRSAFEVLPSSVNNADDDTDSEGNGAFDTMVYSPAKPTRYTATQTAFRWIKHPIRSFKSLLSPSASTYTVYNETGPAVIPGGSTDVEAGINKHLFASYQSTGSLGHETSTGDSSAGDSSKASAESASLTSFKSLSDHKIRRFVDRDGDFHQSRGKISTRKKIGRTAWQTFYGYDLFHSLVNAPTWRTISVLLLGYLLVIIVFSIPYFLISKFYGCNMGIRFYMEAFLFSLETMATVGYSTQDIYFDDCYSPMIVLTLQLLVRIVADAITIGVIYTRLARPSSRASTILFSNHAVIRRIRGKLYFMMQLCELRKHQLLEAHVRLYLIKKEVHIDAMGHGERRNRVFFQTSSMRLNHPNDELNGMILMCMPQIIVHEIDASSPLMPPPRWMQHQDANGNSIRHDWKPPVYDFAFKHDESKTTIPITAREYDAAVLNDLAFPSVCHRNPHLMVKTSKSSPAGNTSSENNLFADSRGFNTFKNYFSPVSDIPCSHTQGDVDIGPNIESDRQQEERAMVQAFMQDRSMEIVAIVEGIDSATGGAVQSRHSFLSSEIEWNSTFAPCVYEADEEGVAVIDFSVFHKLNRVYNDSAFPGLFTSTI